MNIDYKPTVSFKKETTCPSCGRKYLYTDESTRYNPFQEREYIVCPHCGVENYDLTHYETTLCAELSHDVQDWVMKSRKMIDFAREWRNSKRIDRYDRPFEFDDPDKFKKDVDNLLERFKNEVANRITLEAIKTHLSALSMDYINGKYRTRYDDYERENIDNV